MNDYHEHNANNQVQYGGYQTGSYDGIDIEGQMLGNNKGEYDSILLILLPFSYTYYMFSFTKRYMDH